MQQSTETTHTGQNDLLYILQNCEVIKINILHDIVWFTYTARLTIMD